MILAYYPLQTFEKSGSLDLKFYSIKKKYLE